MASLSYLLINGAEHRVYDSVIAFGLMYLVDTAEAHGESANNSAEFAALRDWWTDRAAGAGIYYLDLDKELARIGVSFDYVVKYARLSLARIAADEGSYIDRTVCARIGRAMCWPIDQFQKATLIELFDIIADAKSSGNDGPKQC